MPSRRFHHKRRHGCTNCKGRRSRCGEERPSCQNCIRLETRCSYLDSDQQGAASLASSVSPDRPIIEPRIAFGVSDDQEVELVHHYVNTACFTTTDDTELFPTWQVTIPQMALSSPYLKHGLLALSAMHIRLTSSPHRQPFHAALARRHLSKALESYIPNLQTNTEQTCSALFSFSAILPSLSYSFLQSEDTHLQGQDFIGQFVRVCQFLLGARAVATEARQWINHSVVSPMVTLKSLQNVLPRVADSPRKALESLLDQIRVRNQHLNPLNAHDSGMETDIMMSETRRNKIYEKSAELLSNAFPSIDGQSPRLGVVLGWPVFVDQEFFQLLRHNDPMALIILAYYGAALQSCSGFWWLQDVGARLVRSVAIVVDSNTRQLALWPLVETSQTQAPPP